MSRACHSQSALVSGPAKIPVFSRYLTHVSQPISARYGNARILSLVACSLMPVSANQYFSSSLLGVEGKAAGRFLIFCSVETAAIFQIVISLNSFWRVSLWKFFRRVCFFDELSFFQFLVGVRMYTLRSLLPDEHSQLHVTRYNFTFTRSDQFNHYKMMHRKFVSIYFFSSFLLLLFFLSGPTFRFSNTIKKKRSCVDVPEFAAIFLTWRATSTHR